MSKLRAKGDVGFSYACSIEGEGALKATKVYPVAFSALSKIQSSKGCSLAIVL